LKKISKASSGIYQWVKGILELRVFKESYSLKARLRRSASWDAFVCIKAEEEVTAESFTQWMTDTFACVDNLNKASLTELRAFACPPRGVTLTVRALASLFGCKTDKQIIKFVSTGFKSIKFEQLIEDLKNKRIDDLTLADCINIESNLEGLTTEIMKTQSIAASVLFEFVHNFCHLRIAVGKYGDRTGYSIQEAAAKPEEEKKEVDA
jgi:hypothetical protein